MLSKCNFQGCVLLALTISLLAIWFNVFFHANNNIMQMFQLQQLAGYQIGLFTLFAVTLVFIAGLAAKVGLDTIREDRVYDA